MATNRSDFLSLVDQRIVILDGAMGTSIHALNPTMEDYRGLENCCEILNVTRPDLIERIHREYFEVGADAVETNTFGGAKLTLNEFGIADQCYEINLRAAEIARRAAEAHSTAARPRFVIGSVGPGTKLITLRQTDYDTMLDSYCEQCRGLLDGGADVLLIETCQDILQSKTALHAARLAMEKTGRRVPLMCQVTMETTGTMLVGTDIAAALTVIEAYAEVDVIGLNCATGPQEMSEHIRYLSRYCSRRLSVLPNAGLPQLAGGKTHFPLTPGELAKWLLEFVVEDGVNIVGGCCGTTPAHIKALVEAIGLNRAPKRRTPVYEPGCSSLYSAVPYRQDNSFLIVGERSNTNGSRQFKKLLVDGDVDGCVAMGVDQVKEGSHVLDLCVDYVGRDGVPDMSKVAGRYAVDVTAPLMLDSTEPPVIEAGLKLIGGKCIVNSVNLEDGEEKMAKVAKLLRQFGAAVVALTIDEDPVESMGKTAERKLAIATRIHELLTRKYGVREEDIFFDCLTFPITTGNEADRRLALETLDGIEGVMKRFPKCQSILGVSNVSFGLVPAARAVLNSVFLHEAMQRGLTAAIVHSSKILPRNKIADERWNAALDLIYDRRKRREDGSMSDPLTAFIALFTEQEKVEAKAKIADLPIEERLKRRIIDGEKVGLDGDLAEAMKRYQPLDIINNFLLDGMKVVGELFGSGQMQLPFVLKSAETMKAAVAFLEPHMDKAGGVSRGKIVLATVRGDVHDIGKNLVDIILTNNGYTVYNLGIKQPIANVISAFREHGADVIGLSGLLVKSTLVMRDDLVVLNESGLAPPVILGGAALTRTYVEQDLRAVYKGPLFYAKDAFEGLHRVARIAEGDVSYAAVASDDRPAVTETAIATAESAKAAGEAREGGDRVVASAWSSMNRAAGLKVAIESAQRFGVAEIGDEAEEDAAKLEESFGRAPAPVEGGIAAAAVVPTGAGNPMAAETEGAPGDNAGTEIKKSKSPGTFRAAGIRTDNPVPAPPFWGARVVESIPLKAVLGYMNEVMLFQVQWGYRKKGRSREEWKRYIDGEVRPRYRALVERCEREGILTPKAIYGYWPCNGDGEDLIIYEPVAANAEGATCNEPAPGQAANTESNTTRSLRQDSHSKLPLREIARFTFPRQKKAPYWCLSDFWRPKGGEGAEATHDVIAISIVTAGRRVSEVARQWFAENRYQDYLFLHGLGVETAEALAEYIHKQVRVELGIAEHDARERQRLFQQGYQGSRYSFGYPACPALEDQAKLMKLLKPERIGVTLSEEFQLDPEQSTSAVIAHHPQARYFNVR